jgi:hypothetical protein
MEFHHQGDGAAHRADGRVITGTTILVDHQLMKYAVFFCCKMCLALRNVFSGAGPLRSRSLTRTRELVRFSCLF